MFVENAYPQDTRVRNEATLLSQAGYKVTVIALGKKGQPRTDTVDGVTVYRIPRLELFQKTPREHPTAIQKLLIRMKTLIGYVAEYAYFTTACSAMSLYVALKDGFDIIHAHNPPDTLWLVALPWKLFGKKYVFDHHDLCPELYRSRYKVRRDLLTGILQTVERGNLTLANAVIATNESYKQIEVQRSGRRPDTIFVVRNGPNGNRMELPSPNPRLRGTGKTILCYIGSLNPQDGVDYLLRSLHYLVEDLKRHDFHCVIMGDGDSFDDLCSLSRKLQLNDYVELTGYVSEDELRQNLAAADICVDPDPSSPLNDVSTWIKIMEYMAAAKPIVSFDLKETRYSAGDAALFVPCNDEPAFARAIAKLADDAPLRDRMGRLGRQRVEKELQWSIVGKNLLTAYASLCPKP